MVFKLKPLELSFDFEDREYDLGDTIDIHVDLSPNGEVDVREARVDLVCEERFSQHESGIVVGAGGSSWIQGGGKMRVTTDYVPSSSWVSPNPPKDTDGRREESGRGVRELQGK